MNCTANIAKGLRRDYKGAAMTLCPGGCSKALWLYGRAPCVQPSQLSRLVLAWLATGMARTT